MLSTIRKGVTLAPVSPVFMMGRKWQSSSSGSFFQNFPTGKQKEEEATADQEYHTNKDLRRHPDIHAKLNPAPQKAIDNLSPLKRALYTQNLKQNNGVYKNNQIITHEGRTYRLQLSLEEQRALEPSVYVESYRIKGSWKKSYMFLRIFRRMPVRDAISQCHFSARRMAKDVGEMLGRGCEDAAKIGLDSDDLVIDQIWVGKDGEDEKRLQFKGRGRTGIITSPYVHVKAILKPKYIQEQRQDWIKERLDRKLWFPLRSWKVKEDYVQSANYKW